MSFCILLHLVNLEWKSSCLKWNGISCKLIWLTHFEGIHHLWWPHLRDFGVVVADLGFMTLLSSHVISVTFYSEREKSDKFCSEALISAWGSFMCHKSTIRDRRLYFPSKGSHTQDFYAVKNPSTPAGFEPTNLVSIGKYHNHGTTGVNKELLEISKLTLCGCITRPSY